MTDPRRVPSGRVAELAAGARHRVRPASTLTARGLAVTDAFAPLFPAGLPRGATLSVSGDAARSFVFCLSAAPTRAGAWLAVVGMADAGWRAATEAGIETARVVHVDPGQRGADCVAAALDGFDLVVVGTAVPLGASVQRRLAARAREREVVLVGDAGALDGAADVTVQVVGRGWRGIGTGRGRLAGRRVEVTARGRRVPGRHRSLEVWLPDADGGVTPVAARTVPRNPAAPADVAGRVRSA